jgi:hypothetical protein
MKVANSQFQNKIGEETKIALAEKGEEGTFASL